VFPKGICLRGTLTIRRSVQEQNRSEWGRHIGKLNIRYVLLFIDLYYVSPNKKRFRLGHMWNLRPIVTFFPSYALFLMFKYIKKCWRIIISLLLKYNKYNNIINQLSYTHSRVSRAWVPVHAPVSTCRSKGLIDPLCKPCSINFWMACFVSSHSAIILSMPTEKNDIHLRNFNIPFKTYKGNIIVKFKIYRNVWILLYNIVIPIANSPTREYGSIYAKYTIVWCTHVCRFGNPHELWCAELVHITRLKCTLVDPYVLYT